MKQNLIQLYDRIVTQTEEYWMFQTATVFPPMPQAQSHLQLLDYWPQLQDFLAPYPSPFSLLRQALQDPLVGYQVFSLHWSPSELLLMLYFLSSEEGFVPMADRVRSEVVGECRVQREELGYGNVKSRAPEGQPLVQILLP